MLLKIVPFEILFEEVGHMIKGDVITSRQNASVIAACKLSEKKHRDAEGKFRIDGIKLFEEAVLSGVDIETVFVRQGAVDRLEERIGDLFDKISGTDIKILSDGVFDKISEEKSPEGILCVVKRIDKLHKIVTINNDDDLKTETILASHAKIFAVESVRDPGNLGTIIRTAAAFGVDVLLISYDCADIYNSKTVRAAMGALFRQKIIRTSNFSEVLRFLSRNGRTTYAATLGKEAVLLGNDTPDESGCIVVGNEGHGLSEKTIEACDHNILIPMAEGAESLNAAIAASVCMWEQFGKHITNHSI